MTKKLLIAWIAVFVVKMAGSFLVHAQLLHADYALLPNLMRTESDAQQHFPLILLAHAISCAAFVWIYARGAESKPWVAQGVRYGVAIALLAIVPTYMIYYVVEPLPGALVCKQVAFDSILMVVLGVVAAAVIRQPVRA